MDEQFLHYIWKYQKFNFCDLILTDGQNLNVFYPGNHNHDSGPDFEESRIKIGTIEWAGKVEIHINSSDWLYHNHEKDPAYNSVILHVVWNHDKDIHIEGQKIPTLELKGIVDPYLINGYKTYITSTDEILCGSQISSVSSLKVVSMLDRALIERLGDKSDEILAILRSNTNDWQQITYRTLAANFGFSTNKESFIRLTELLPFETLKKVLQNQKSTEAMLFGQSGFLEDAEDEYQRELKVEHTFLRQKFQLKEPLNKALWKYGKLRPANFPSVRLSQLAILLHNQPQLFSFIIATESIERMKEKLLINVSEYWQAHYDFGKPRKKSTSTMGDASFDNLMINSIAPILAAYSRYTGDQKYMDRAIAILESTAAEYNRITKKWAPLGIKSKTAFDSQALIQLHKNYCQKRRCLQCNIGVEILNK